MAMGPHSESISSERTRQRTGGGRLVFLYGPPAVGKLTVARALSAQTAFRVLDNHATLDAVAAVFEFGSEPFWRLLRRLRRDLLTAAAREQVDLVYTFCYAPEDEPVVAELLATWEGAGGEMLFVQLLAPRAELLRRVSGESRHAHRKIVDPAELARVLDRYDFSRAVAVRPSLTLDLASLSPAEAAARIVTALAGTEGDDCA